MCTDKTHPELSRMSDAPPRDINVTYINHTKGVWIRHNTAKAEQELWYDGEFQASWNDTIDPITLAMAVGRDCLDLGERKKAAEVRAVLGVR